MALPNALNANEKVSSEMSDIEANKILLGQVLSVCYAVDRNHITMKQKIDMLGFALNLHERAHGNKQTIQEDQMNAVGKVWISSQIVLINRINDYWKTKLINLQKRTL